MSGGSQEGELPASREDQARPGGDFEDRDRSSRAVEAGDLPGGQTVRGVDSGDEGVVDVPSFMRRDGPTTYTETDEPLTAEERRELEAAKAAEAGPPMFRGPVAEPETTGGADYVRPWRQSSPPQRSAEPPPGTVAAGAGDEPPPPGGGGDPDDERSAGEASAARMYDALRAQRADHPTQQLRPEVGGAAVRPPGARDAGTPAAEEQRPKVRYVDPDVPYVDPDSQAQNQRKRADKGSNPSGRRWRLRWPGSGEPKKG